MSREHDMTDPKSPRDSLPFPRRWLGYIAIKLIVLAIAVYVALRWQGVI
jgi:hypothetical protein